MPESRHGTETSSVVFTDAGMLALWDTARFSGVVDYDSWEAELLDDEDLIGHIDAGELVPITVASDGMWQVLVRTGTAAEPARLTGRENRYLRSTAEPYLLISTGEVRLSGLEAIGVDLLERTTEFGLPAGRYMVRAHLIDWASEPGSRKDTGEPLPHALPDFVILVDPEQGQPTYRACVESFDEPAD
jgi:hypothetical protein